MNQLQTLINLGVKNLTVKDGYATAVNPFLYAGHGYQQYLKEFNERNLPPLPTSNIPNGKVSIQDVEEHEQVYSELLDQWVKATKEFRKSAKLRTALVYKQLKEEEALKLKSKEEVKPEREEPIYFGDRDDAITFDTIQYKQPEVKPEGESCIAGCNHYTGGEIKHHIHCPFYPDSLSRTYDEMEKDLERLSSLPQPEQPEQPAIPQAEKEEQTAEGMEQIKDQVAQEVGYTDWLDFCRDCQLCAPRMESRMNRVAEIYAEQSLSQYKAELIGKLEAKLNREDARFAIYHADGIQEAIDLIKTP